MKDYLLNHFINFNLDFTHDLNLLLVYLINFYLNLKEYSNFYHFMILIDLIFFLPFQQYYFLFY